MGLVHKANKKLSHKEVGQNKKAAITQTPKKEKLINHVSHGGHTLECCTLSGNTSGNVDDTYSLK